MTPTNRAQRRALARAKPPKRLRPVDMNAPLRKLVNAAPHTPEETVCEHIKLHAAFERLCDGTADTEDFDHVAMKINMCKVRALEISNSLADALEAAQDAMGRCKERYYRTDRFGFDGPSLQQMRDALSICEAIIDNSSPLQMAKARDVVVDTLFGRGFAARMKEQARHARAKEGGAA